MVNIPPEPQESALAHVSTVLCESALAAYVDAKPNEAALAYVPAVSHESALVILRVGIRPHSSTSSLKPNIHAELHGAVGFRTERETSWDTVNLQKPVVRK